MVILGRECPGQPSSGRVTVLPVTDPRYFDNNSASTSVPSAKKGNIPRLSDRREDIPKLASYFLQTAAKELDVEAKTLRPETEKYLIGLSWPGNVRQLENFCRWITVMASSREVYMTDLPPEFAT